MKSRGSSLGSVLCVPEMESEKKKIKSDASIESTKAKLSTLYSYCLVVMNKLLQTVNY